MMLLYSAGNPTGSPGGDEVVARAKPEHSELRRKEQVLFVDGPIWPIPE
jgi:hypothetical protein